MNVASGQLARVRQVHGASVAVHRTGAASHSTLRPEADIVISENPDVAVAVQTADCVPILIQGLGVVAAVHAGWRGLAARVPAVAVERIVGDFGQRADDLIVAIGPAIGPCCYEVGQDVRSRFEDASFTRQQVGRWFSAHPSDLIVNPSMPSLSPVRRSDRFFFDASLSAYDQLRSAGVGGARIFVSGLCTASHPRVFCSYRRDGAPAGRMAAAVRWRPPD